MMENTELNGAIEKFAQMAADAERRAQRFGRLQDRMAALTATDTGAGGRVTVTVDSSGIPTAIDLTPDVRAMDSRALSVEILSCMRRAQGKLRSGIAQMVHDVVGEDPAGAALVDGFNERFPEPQAGGPSPDNAAPENHRLSSPSAMSSSPTPQPPPPAWGASAPTQSQPQPRKSFRDQVVTPTDEVDEEDEYYRRKSWLV